MGSRISNCFLCFGDGNKETMRLACETACLKETGISIRQTGSCITKVIL